MPLPGAKDQKPVPTVPFLAASFALGFFALGPYLSVREIRDEPIQRSSLGWVTRNILVRLYALRTNCLPQKGQGSAFLRSMSFSGTPERGED